MWPVTCFGWKPPLIIPSHKWLPAPRWYVNKAPQSLAHCHASVVWWAATGNNTPCRVPGANPGPSAWQACDLPLGHGSCSMLNEARSDDVINKFHIWASTSWKITFNWTLIGLNCYHEYLCSIYGLWVQEIPDRMTYDKQGFPTVNMQYQRPKVGMNLSIFFYFTSFWRDTVN